jgi:hypothetical protein
MNRYRVFYWLSLAGMMIATSFWGQFVSFVMEQIAVQFEDRGIFTLLVLYISPVVLWIFWFIFSLEVFIKLQIVRGISPKPPTLTTPEHWPNLDASALEAATREFEQLGFVWLTDFTYSPMRGLIRLMCHPQQKCIVEISQLERQPMVMAISSRLEQDWFCFVISAKAHKLLAIAGWWVFYRQPQDLHRRVEGLSPQDLNAEFLKFRQEVCSRLDLEVIPITTAEQFFGFVTQRRNKLRRQLWGKSMTLGYLDMLIFATNPKYEYVGDDLVAGPKAS